MGLVYSYLYPLLTNMQINSDQIIELSNDHVVYTCDGVSKKFIFAEEISQTCFEILSKIKLEGGTCKVDYQNDIILVITDGCHAYPVSYVNPSTFGWTLSL
jgi:hypothetical protein